MKSRGERLDANLTLTTRLKRRSKWTVLALIILRNAYPH